MRIVPKNSERNNLSLKIRTPTKLAVTPKSVEKMGTNHKKYGLTS